MVQDGVDLFGDGHFHFVARGELERGGGGAYSFGDFAVECDESFREGMAFAEFHADPAVARE